jgi:hypothetical protein
MRNIGSEIGEREIAVDALCVPSIRPRPLAALLVLALLVVLLAALWWIDPAKTHLPVCSFRATTGMDCPGCGATRATHELLHGRPLAAWRLNPLWVTLIPLAVYLTASELRMLWVGRPLPGDLPRQPWLWVALFSVSAAFFVVRNCPFEMVRW